MLSMNCFHLIQPFKKCVKSFVRKSSLRVESNKHHAWINWEWKCSCKNWSIKWKWLNKWQNSAVGRHLNWFLHMVVFFELNICIQNSQCILYSVFCGWISIECEWSNSYSRVTCSLTILCTTSIKLSVESEIEI